MVYGPASVWGPTLCPMAGPAGFWSYARDDDERDHGRIRRLAEAVRSEYALLTGEELELFIDRDLRWGDVWKERIDQALRATTFFIPVITPLYFQRPECRNELLTFVGHAKSLGRAELVLPVYYAPVPGLGDEDETDDEAVTVVGGMQWEDWRDLRLEREDSSAHRRAVNGLATRLGEIGRQATEQIEEVGVATTPEVNEAGILDLVAEAEKAWPRFNRVLEDLGGEMEMVGAMADEWIRNWNERRRRVLPLRSLRFAPEPKRSTRPQNELISWAVSGLPSWSPLTLRC